MLLMEGMTLNNDEDCRTCSFADEDKFLVKACYQAIARGEQSISQRSKRIWNKNVPSKVCILVLSACQKAIPTLDALKRKGSFVVDACPLCLQDEESASHIFIHCKQTKPLWDYFLNSLNITWAHANTIEDVWFSWDICKLNKLQRKVWALIPIAVVWTVWLERNRRDFESITMELPELIRKCKSFIYLWGVENKFFMGFNFTDFLERWELLLNQ